MEITLRERMAKNVEDLLGPDDNIVFQCLGCETYLLPREYNVLKKQWRGKDGHAYAVGYELCPVCFPNPSELRQEAFIDASGYEVLTREDFLMRKRYERAGIIPPERRPILQNVQ